MNVEHSGDPFIKDSMREFGETIFAEMSALAAKTGAINLGHGFPDTDGPQEICLLYTSPSPRDQRGSRMPSSA